MEGGREGERGQEAPPPPSLGAGTPRQETGLAALRGCPGPPGSAGLFLTPRLSQSGSARACLAHTRQQRRRRPSSGEERALQRAGTALPQPAWPASLRRQPIAAAPAPAAHRA